MGILGITLWTARSVRSRGVCGAKLEFLCVLSGGTLLFRVWQKERFLWNAYAHFRERSSLTFIGSGWRGKASYQRDSELSEGS